MFLTFFFVRLKARRTGICALACECKTRSMNYGPIIIAEQHNMAYMLGAFNNYVDKKRGRGGQPKIYACPPGGGPLNVHVDKNLFQIIHTSYYWR